VATPLGNLEDITLRAIKILTAVDLIAAEDTRRTLKLLNHYQIKQKLMSYFQHNERERSVELIQKLLSGQNIALVSDAGMPGISDPGCCLVREAISNGISVIPIPGPTAVITALAASGLNTDSFWFEGFLPRKEDQQRVKLKEMAGFTGTLVFYESPHRLIHTLQNISQIFGERRIVLARELTKIHEEFIRGNPAELLAKLDNAGDLKGEFTIVIEGYEVNKRLELVEDSAPIDFSTLLSSAQVYAPESSNSATPKPLTLRAEIRAIARKTGKKTREIYQLYLADQQNKK
jgi:16S rRNA (cytidine1402-2'-O)-methyltransferase